MVRAGRRVAPDTESRPADWPIDNPSATGCDSFRRPPDGILPATERAKRSGLVQLECLLNELIPTLAIVLLAAEPTRCD